MTKLPAPLLLLLAGACSSPPPVPPDTAGPGGATTGIAAGGSGYKPLECITKPAIGACAWHTEENPDAGLLCFNGPLVGAREAGAPSVAIAQTARGQEQECGCASRCICFIGGWGVCDGGPVVACSGPSSDALYCP